MPRPFKTTHTNYMKSHNLIFSCLAAKPTIANTLPAQKRLHRSSKAKRKLVLSTSNANTSTHTCTHTHAHTPDKWGEELDCCWLGLGRTHAIQPHPHRNQFPMALCIKHIQFICGVYISIILTNSLLSSVPSSSSSSLWIIAHWFVCWLPLSLRTI